MPGRRSRWTATELNYLMQLCDEGIEIDSTIFQENSHRNLRISQGPDLGVVFDLDPYNTGYAISVHLVASSRLYLAECFIESDWHPEIELEEFDDCRPKFGPVVYRPQDVLNSKVQERAALSRGRSLLKQGHADQALGYLETALALYTQTNNPRGIAAAQDGLGDLYLIQGQYKVALDHYQKAYESFVVARGKDQTDAGAANSVASRAGSTASAAT